MMRPAQALLNIKSAAPQFCMTLICPQYFVLEEVNVRRQLEGSELMGLREEVQICGFNVFSGS